MKAWLAENWLAMGALAIALASFLWQVVSHVAAKRPRVIVSATYSPAMPLEFTDKTKEPPEHCAIQCPWNLSAKVVNDGERDLYLRPLTLIWPHKNGREYVRMLMSDGRSGPIRPGDERNYTYHPRPHDPDILTLPRDGVEVQVHNMKRKIFTLKGNEIDWIYGPHHAKPVNPDT